MRYLTSGESHGPQLTVIIEGVPANLEITAEDINKEMFKRQGDMVGGVVCKLKRYYRNCVRRQKWLFFGKSNNFSSY